MSKTAFIGHRKVYFSYKVKKRLEIAIDEQVKSGCKVFTMGTHGEFDSMALSACKKARASNPDIEINVVITSYHLIEKKNEYDYVPYQDVNTLMYEIEDEHFKRRITKSNRYMIDDCDTLICYVDKTKNPSGAKSTMNYAQKKGIKIINIFNEKDNPTFNMSAEEKNAYFDKILKELKNN